MSRKGRTKPKFRTAAEKRMIVEAYFARAEGVSGRQIAEEHGVPPTLIYNWRKKIEEGESLGPEEEEPSEPVVPRGVVQQKLARALERAKQAHQPPSAELAPARPSRHNQDEEKRREFLFEEKPAAATLEMSTLRQENAQLKQELAKVKRALATLLTDD